MLLPLLIAATLALPAPTAPPDDPSFARCLDPRAGVRLDWQRPQEDLRVYLLVKRLDANGAWRVWLKTERANPPFTLTMHAPTARHSQFAWMLFAVTPEQEIERGQWRFFCTQ
jgi:hypothetical protein